MRDVGLRSADQEMLGRELGRHGEGLPRREGRGEERMRRRGYRVGGLLESRLSGAMEVMEGIGIFVAHWRENVDRGFWLNPQGARCP